MSLSRMSCLLSRSLPIRISTKYAPCLHYLPPFRNTTQPTCIHTSMSLSDDPKKDRRWPFHMTMSDEQKKQKEDRIQKAKAEEPPKTLLAKVKYYFKRYWYIAVPAHIASCSAWFALFFGLVHSGVDVIALLELMHLPEALIEKVKNVPPSAGEFVVAFLLYKIASPLRYATTLVLIQGSFWALRRMGKLQTAREVEYKMRTEYEKNKMLYGRKMYRYRKKLGVRDISRRNAQGNEHKQNGGPTENK